MMFSPGCCCDAVRICSWCSVVPDQLQVTLSGFFNNATGGCPLSCDDINGSYILDRVGDDGNNCRWQIDPFDPSGLSNCLLQITVIFDTDTGLINVDVNVTGGVTITHYIFIGPTVFSETIDCTTIIDEPVDFDHTTLVGPQNCNNSSTNPDPVMVTAL